MVDPVSQSVSWSVIDGVSLLLGPLRKTISKSGLSVAFQSGRVGAVGLDFYSDYKQERYDHFISWDFVLKVVNPNNYAIALESVSAQWAIPKGTFYAATSNYNTGFIKPIHPKASLPDDGDESLPRLIPANSTELLQVSCMLELYRRRFYPWKKRQSYTRENYGQEPQNIQFVVRVKTNKGTTKLKSS